MNKVENLSTAFVYNSKMGFRPVDSVEKLSTACVEKKGIALLC